MPENDNHLSLEEAADQLFERTDNESILVALSENGMKLFQRNNESLHFPLNARKVFDVTWAGDNVIAPLAVALAARLDIRNAINLDYTSVRLAVEKVGNTFVYFDELSEAIRITKRRDIELYENSGPKIKNLAGYSS